MKIFVRSGKRPNRYSLILVVTCCLLWLNNAFANGNKTPMIGSWKFDVDSSLARCERLQAHDCSTWENLDTEQKIQLEMFSWQLFVFPWDIIWVAYLNLLYQYGV